MTGFFLDCEEDFPVPKVYSAKLQMQMSLKALFSFINPMIPMCLDPKEGKGSKANAYVSYSFFLTVLCIHTCQKMLRLYEDHEP